MLHEMLMKWDGFIIIPYIFIINKKKRSFLTLLSLEMSFPRNYVAVIKQIFTRIFRIFAIIYTHHFGKLEEVGATAHLNTSFKHFLFFVWEFDLVDVREMDAISGIVSEFRVKFESST